MTNVLVSIPSYHRVPMLMDALRSFRLLLDVPAVSWHVVPWVQDCTPEEKDGLQQLAKELSCPRLKIRPRFAEKQHCNIGKIMRLACEHALDDFAANESGMLPDFLLMSDDDVLVVHSHTHEAFVANFAAMMRDMRESNVDIGSATIGGSHVFRRRLFPSERLETPFKERFILLSQSVLQAGTIVQYEMDELAVGEDLFIFLKGFIAGYKIGVYDGVTDWLHLPHMDGNRELVNANTTGGFAELAQSLDPSADESNKYRVVASKTRASVQHKFHDFFDWAMVSDVRNPLRSDIEQYVRLNFTIDENKYVTRLNTLRLFKHRNIRMLFDAVSGDAYSDQAQEVQREVHGQDYTVPELVAFVKRNVQYPSMEAGPGSGYLATHGIHSSSYLEPSFNMCSRLRENLAKLGATGVVVNGVLECIPENLPHYGELRSIIFVNGFFQVRSDYECLIEVNTALAIGGRFILNVLPDDSTDIICGRVLGVRNYARLIAQFGFVPVEVLPESGFICMEKVEHFDPKFLSKLQRVE